MKYRSVIFGGILSAASGAPADSFFQSKTVIIPKDATLEKGGEDSADCSDGLLVVADGVGGWAARGIDSGIFSKKMTA